MEEQHPRLRPGTPQAGSTTEAGSDTATVADGAAAVPEWPHLPSPVGDAAVDDVLARLAALTDLPVTEQAAAFGQIHEQLAAVLDGEAAEQPGGPLPEGH